MNYFLRTETFWKEIACLILKSLLPTPLNFRELRRSLTYRGISSQPLSKIMSQRNSRLYMPLTVKLADGRVSMKKEKKYSYLIYNIVSLGKMAEKPFS